MTSHQKYFLIQGTYDGVPNTTMVRTGSSNWASLSTADDEIWLTIHGKTAANKYLKNFNYEWDTSATRATPTPPPTPASGSFGWSETPTAP